MSYQRKILEKSKNNELNSKNENNQINDKILNKESLEMTKTHPTVYIIFFSLLLDLLAFTMILPLLPSLLEYYRINDKFGLYNTLSENVRVFQEWVGAPAKYNSVLFGGALGSMFSFLQFAASPIVGGLSDVYGRKPIMLFCLVIYLFTYCFKFINYIYFIYFSLVLLDHMDYGQYQKILDYLY